MINEKPTVITVSAISGGGKTSVVNELLSLLDPSVAVSFDSYKGDLLGMDYCAWSEAGADANAWHLDDIVRDIHRYIDEGYPYILVDYPFGRAYRDISDLADFAVFIDTPLDIAFARRVERDYCHRDPSRRPIPNPLEHLSKYIAFYQKRHRNTYFMHIDTVKPTCDFVISGLASPREIALRIIEQLH